MTYVKTAFFPLPFLFFSQFPVLSSYPWIKWICWLWPNSRAVFTVLSAACLGFASLRGKHSRNPYLCSPVCWFVCLLVFSDFTPNDDSVASAFMFMTCIIFPDLNSPTHSLLAFEALRSQRITKGNEGLFLSLSSDEWHFESCMCSTLY